MAFQIKAGESVSDGIRRNVKRQIEKALKYLGVDGKGGGDGEADAAPDAREVRKCFKKVRAALRLVRKDLGGDAYRAENLCFRDAGRVLREVRDARVLVETLEKLSSELASGIDQEAISNIQAALRAREKEIAGRVFDVEKGAAAVAEVATQALSRLPRWRIEREGWSAIEGGVRRAYRSAQRTFGVATKNPSTPNLHEWRKQTRHLRNQLQLLQAAWGNREKALDEQTRKLVQLLGDDHDLAILRQSLAADPPVYGGHRVLKSVFGIIDRKREELRREANAIGEELFRDSPEAFAERIEAYWSAWAAKDEAARLPAKAHLAHEHAKTSAVRGRRP